MRTGETIRNHRSGESLTMIEGELESAGARQFYRVTQPAGTPGPPLHYHTRFTERFTAVEGQLALYLGKQQHRVVLETGQCMTAEIGQLHRFANESDAAVVFTVETRPPGGVVRAFEMAWGAANDGLAGDDGWPRHPLGRLYLIRTSEGYLPGVPLALQRGMMGIAALLARVTGVAQRLERYAR